jgi:hypothetical protein
MVPAVLMGLYHPLDGITNPMYKLLHFLTTIFFCKGKKALVFNQNRCCHLALCLHLILFPYFTNLLITFGYYTGGTLNLPILLAKWMSYQFCICFGVGGLE